MNITQIREDLKNAMRAKEQVKVDTLRGAITAFTNELVAKGHKPTDELSSDDMLAVLKRLAKQRKDSIDQFEKGGRPEMAAKEKEELVIIEAYLPQASRLRHRPVPSSSFRACSNIGVIMRSNGPSLK
jgi:uncharacterized protein YqeY